MKRKPTENKWEWGEKKRKLYSQQVVHIACGTLEESLMDNFVVHTTVVWGSRGRELKKEIMKRGT